MKLEIKHLSAYLPYGLKLYAGEYFVENNLDVILDRLDVTTKAIDASNLDGVWFIDEVKPLLRPLSQLTQEIEVNGEKFVPIVELLKIKNKGWYIEKQGTRYCEIDFELTYNYANVETRAYTYVKTRAQTYVKYK
jgi:hypothetical protein